MPMPLKRPRPVLFFSFVVVAALSPLPAPCTAASKPPFWYGVSTSSYQIEGAATEGGRGPSIWDTFSHEPGRTARGDTGDVAADFYHRYRDDVALARELGARKFRLSISWPRIFPNKTTTRFEEDDGKIVVAEEEPNERGLAFYDGVLDALEESGIEPLITLYHWDLPQALQDEYGGWTSERIVDDFRVYARTVFERLGARGAMGKKKKEKKAFFSLENDDDVDDDRDVDADDAADAADAASAADNRPQVKYWTSLNEPWVFCFLGHVVGVHAPGIRSAEAGWACARNALLAHLAAAEEFEKVFGRCDGDSDDDHDDDDDADDADDDDKNNKNKNCPLLSVNVPTQWSVPWSSDSDEDAAAARRALDFDGLGTFADVLFKGQWPSSILDALARANATSSFVAPPPFSEREVAAFLRHRPRYFALNFYTSYWARATAASDPRGTVDPQTGLEAGFVKAQVREAVFPSAAAAGIGDDDDDDDERSGDGSGAGDAGKEGKGNETIGVPGAPSWLFSTPWAMRLILNEVNERYAPLEEIIVTENGFATRAEQRQQREHGGAAEAGEKDQQKHRGGVFDDAERVDFFRGYLSSAADAARIDGVPLTGYCAWSLLDNFEWADGYDMRFGVVRVDFDDDDDDGGAARRRRQQRRTVKRSALWLRDFFNGGGGDGAGGVENDDDDDDRRRRHRSNNVDVE